MNEKPERIELHTHSLLSDGVLLPSELLRRAAAMGHEALAITDHVDSGNLERVIESLLRLRHDQHDDFGTQLLVGVEITHVGPRHLGRLARQAKDLGADIVLVHGETPVEPVAAGTNRAAIECVEVDLLAHPGFLTLAEARLAADRGCHIEITARKGHSLTNGHVARLCSQVGALMVVDTDAHEPQDLISIEFARHVAMGAGLSADQAENACVSTPRALVERLLLPRGARV
jgi:histidinol phosphatase-like PHP family hydrolase